MVKKIRVIEDSSLPEEMTDESFRTQVMELAKAADWKLWEMLQAIQRLEKKIDFTDND